MTVIEGNEVSTLELAVVKAIDDSIAKWEMNLEVSEISELKIAVRDCALCDIFIMCGCKNCPIMQKTGRDRCRGTPYEELISLIRLARYNAAYEEHGGLPITVGMYALIHKEIDFLKSLRK